MKIRSFQRTVLLSVGLLLAVVFVLSGLMWRAWRQEKLDQVLVAAVKLRSLSEVQKALHAGADPNAHDHEQMPSLWSFLQKKLHHRTIPTAEEESALNIAADGPHDGGDTRVSSLDVDILRALLQAGADPNEITSDEDTALIRVVRDDFPLEAVQLLLDHHARVEAGGQPDTTALMQAAMKDEIEKSGPQIHLLIRYGANVNAVSDRGETPLILAAQGGNASAMEALLHYHPDLAARDVDGQTAFDYAKNNGNTLCLHLLQRADFMKPSAGKQNRLLPVLDVSQDTPDIRERLKAYFLLKDKDFDPKGCLLTHFSYLGKLTTANGQMYVCEARWVLEGMRAPRGFGYIIFSDQHCQYLGKIAYKGVNPLWCVQGKLYLFGTLNVPLEPGWSDCPHLPEQEREGNVIDASKGFEEMRIYHQKVYGSSGGVSDP